MDSLKHVNIRLKGGKIPSNPAVELEAFAGISQPHVNHVKSMYQELAHQEIQEFVPVLVLESNSEESCQKIVELFQKLFDGFFSDGEEPEYYLNDRYLRYFSKNLDEEFDRRPVFVPKVFGNGKSVIIQFNPINAFKSFLQNKTEIYSEDFAQELEKPQEFKAKFQTDKHSSALLKSNQLISELFETFLIDISLNISKDLRSFLFQLLCKRDRKLKSLLSMAEFLNSFNLELDLNDLSDLLNPDSDSDSQHLRLLKETLREFEVIKRYIPSRSIRSKRRGRFLSELHENISHHFQAFVVTPQAAAFVKLSIPGYFEYLLRENDNDY